MIKIFFLFSLFYIASGIVLVETQDSRLVVMDRYSQKEILLHLVKYVDESLGLSCELKNTTDENVSLAWILPISEQNRSQNILMDDIASNDTSILLHNEIFENGSLKLDIDRLQISDSGSYICLAHQNDTEIYNHTIKLIVRPKASCGKKFECDDNRCISPIYKCDGIPDCKSKIDESPKICGENPCKGRIKCDNGRCIPKDWCDLCDPLKMNCTNRHRPDCCPSLEPIPFAKGIFPNGDGSYSRRDSPIHHHYDINFIQTTIYSIIGCALVFMVIVTVLGIAICRVHLKRTPPIHIPNNRRAFATTAYHRAFTQEIGVYDLDFAMNRAEGPGLLVTYNINNGVQIVGSPIDPPPYSEVASLPPREGPPPPYTLSQPYDGSQNLRNVRSVQCETSPKPGNRPLRHGLSHARVSSEPSLLNVNRL